MANIMCDPEINGLYVSIHFVIVINWYKNNWPKQRTSLHKIALFTPGELN